MVELADCAGERLAQLGLLKCTIDRVFRWASREGPVGAGFIPYYWRTAVSEGAALVICVMNSSSPVPPSTACFQLDYEPAHQLLRLQWQALSSLHHVRTCLLAVYERVREQGACRVLLDLHGMPELSAQDRYWLETCYLPLLPKLPLQQVGLVLTSHTQHQTLLEMSNVLPAFDVQVFDDAETALEWLRQPATRHPAPWLVGFRANAYAA